MKRKKLFVYAIVTILSLIIFLKETDSRIISTEFLTKNVTIKTIDLQTPEITGTWFQTSTNSARSLSFTSALKYTLLFTLEVSMFGYSIEKYETGNYKIEGNRLTITPVTIERTKINNSDNSKTQLSNGELVSEVFTFYIKHNDYGRTRLHLIDVNGHDSSYAKSE